ncbi:MAG TPA: ATP-binding protein, partial [Gammaproteobacteria bacterium]|nr:ATP-binding protein [Gammaproteobacteria bacterium]
VNRELAGFLSFVSHHDFSIRVPIGEKGKPFRELEFAYEALIGNFRRLNLEKAANYRYLESVIQHVSVALICLDDADVVTLMNPQAKALFRTPHLNSLKSFRRVDAGLPALIAGLGDGGRALVGVRIAGEPLQLALYATEFQLLGHRYRIISFQNIRDELEQREVDYSQKLIKVLTHEIMNSVTPIIALTKLVEDRLVDKGSGEVSASALSPVERSDLRRSLESIQARGSALLRFVQAYRSLTNLPRPDVREIGIEALFERVAALMAPALRAEGIELQTDIAPSGLVLRVDPEQLEQVLINLIRNAGEALGGRADGRITLRAFDDDRGKVSIQVVDNGPGIDADKLDDIFVPFFTTKRKGTGVGLSLSRQIMFLNKGLISVRTDGCGSVFTLKFR